MGLFTDIMGEALNKSVKEGPAKRKADDMAKKNRNKTPDLDTLIELALDAYGDDHEHEAEP